MVRRRGRRFRAILVAGALAAAGGAYLAGNAVSTSGAGEGRGTVTVTTTPSGQPAVSTHDFSLP